MKLYSVKELLRTWWPLLLLFIVALFIRLWSLGSLPGTFFDDEVLSGYLGRYILQNGVDLYGNSWPLLYFNKFGDYYIILPMYLDGLSTYIFGVTQFATRFPTAVIGALAVFPIAGLSWVTWKRRGAALLAALIVALAPWHIVLSRATTESVLEMTIGLVAVWLLLLAVTKRRVILILFALLVSLLTYLIYHSSRVWLPLTWLGVAVIFFSNIMTQKKLLITVLLSVFILFGVTAYISTTPWGRGRFEQTSLFSEQSGVAGRTQEMIYNLGPDNALLARSVHNKVTGYSREFIRQYLSYFSPLFLFTNDGWVKTRYEVPESGPLLVTSLLILLTLLIPVKQKFSSNKKVVFVLLWLLAVAPVAPSFTIIESPSVRRSLILLAPLALFIGFAWYRSCFIRFGKLSLFWLLTCIFVLEWLMFVYLYVLQSDRVTSPYRSDGTMQVAEYILDHKDSLGPIVLSNKNTFPAYYLFAKKDFNPVYSEEFGLNLSIDSLDTIKFNYTDCPDLAPLTPSLTNGVVATASTIIAQRFCEYPAGSVKLVDEILGVNPMLGYQVLQQVSENE